MLVPVVCFTCGGPVGDKAALFRLMHRRAVEASTDSPDCLKIFIKLKVTSDCCRIALRHSMIFTDYQ